ncbi:MAG: transcriptional repressor [Ignavibacteriales bacterium]|nr:MAG: transcriptional repressor [Ignavibacteriaceae bacterium]MBW7874082.1 transcriptional repressor [Ignavibacteria bacterium]MBZ0196087.1 transcriptional repressor [Ignavibacteriaceae bacterium]MCZ2143182.1 transcriptional repressor [Ignavibacteriales bacterium]WKZ72489.1 MAG: transcriptional repressor [Ignavibacteriaceae bacterium]
MKKPETLLKRHHVRVTNIRKEIVAALLEKETALSYREIRDCICESHDRVTVYRTLNTFVNEGIMHTISSADGVVRYALCSDGSCEPHHHDDRHIHFLCKKCGRTFCLPFRAQPDFEIPTGYKMDSFEISVSGLCENCLNPS